MQILPSFDPGADIGRQVGVGLGSGLDLLQQQRQAARQQQQYQQSLSGAFQAIEKLKQNPQAGPAHALGILAQALQGNPNAEAIMKQAAPLLEQEFARPQEDPRFALQQQADEVKRNLLDMGFPEEEAAPIAQYYARADAGGRTEITRHVMDRLSRQEKGPDRNRIEGQKELGAQDAERPRINDPLAGLTPKEKQQRISALRKENSPHYTKSKDELSSLKDSQDAFSRMEKLIDSGKIRQGLGNYLAFDSNGNIRFPQLAKAEELAYQKELAGLIKGAKDTFGARVTNFDLESFMRQFPDARTTPEGAAMLFASLRTVNEINQEKAKALVDVYQEYGVGNILQEDADAEAERRSAPKIAQLKENFDLIPKAPQIKEARQKAPPGFEVIVKPDGELGYVHRRDLKKAVEEGGRRLRTDGFGYTTGPKAEATPKTSESSGAQYYAIPSAEATEPSEPSVQYLDVPVPDEDKQQGLLSSLGSGLTGSIKLGAKNLARAGEAIAGLPGDLNALASGLIESVTGPLSSRGQEGIQIPTSADIRSAVKDVTGGALEPEGRIEEFLGEISGDFASLALPVKGKIPFERAIAGAIAGNTSKELAKEMGFGEGAQSIAKMGSMLAAGIMRRPGLRNEASEMYKRAAELSGEARVSAKPIQDEITSLRNQIAKGTETPNREAVLKQLALVEKKLQNGSISVAEAMETKKSLNEFISSNIQHKDIRSLITRVKKGVEKSIGEFSAKNPEFAKNYREANQIWSVLDKSQNLTDWSKKIFAEGKWPSAAVVFGIGKLRSPIDALNLLSTNPAVQKHYLKMLKMAVDENKAGFIRAAEQLDTSIDNARYAAKLPPIWDPNTQAKSE